MKCKIAIFVLLLVGLPQAAAETGTSMILVSDNYADCAVAEALVDESGATIVKTIWGEFEQPVLDTIVEAAPEEVIIIGGPMAVVEEYGTQLEEANISVSRAWGQTRQQTSLAVFNRFREQYNWSATVGDGTEPYRVAGKCPVWYFDNETEIDNFLQERRATVLNYGMSQRFAGRYGLTKTNVTSAEVQNFGLQIKERIRTHYANHSWVHQHVGMGAGSGLGMGHGMG